MTTFGISAVPGRAVPGRMVPGAGVSITVTVTPTAAGEVYQWNGTDWLPYQWGTGAIGPGAVGPSQLAGTITARSLGGITTTIGTTAPATGNQTGDVFINETTGQISQYSGGAWNAITIDAQTVIQAGSIYGNQIVAGASISSPVIEGGTITGAVFNGTNWIENDDGMFLYSEPVVNGVPVAGSLIASITPAGGTDGGGNAYYAGINSYYDNNGDYANLFGYTLGFSASNGGYAGIYLVPSEVLTYLYVEGDGAYFGGSIYAKDPASSSANPNPETWHTVTLGSPWTAESGYAAPSYRLLPDGNLQLTGCANFGSVTTGNANLNSASPIPAEYRPLTTKTIGRYSAEGSRGFIQITSSGVIEMLASTTYPAQFAEIDAVIPLNL